MAAGGATGHRLAGLDALRGVAIALVIARHAMPSAFGGAGVVGVTMFFALSGYLITGLLVRDLTGAGAVDYRRFYRHRVFRLAPALLALLFVFVLVDGVLNVMGERAMVPRTLIVALTYTADIPYLGVVAHSMGHLWTLAIEEQFYLLWPALLAFAFRRRIVAKVLIAAAVVTYLGLFASLALTSPDYARVYMLPSSWAIAMILGCAARLGDRRVTAWLAGHPRARVAARLLAALVLIAIAVGPEAKAYAVTYVVGAPAIALATIVLIHWVREWTHVHALLRPLVGLGLISYAAYLWNFPLTIWLTGYGQAWRVIGVPVLTILAATVSWFALERPMQRLRRRVDARVGT